MHHGYRASQRPRPLLDGAVTRLLAALPLWGLGMMTGAAVVLTGFDLVLPDPIPLLDEASLLALDWKVWCEWKRRRAETLQAPPT